MPSASPQRYERFYLVLNLTAPAILAGTLVRYPPLARIIDSRIATGGVPASEIATALLAVLGFTGSLYLLFTKNKDELIRHYWRRAATFTFAVLLLSPLLIGVATGLYIGFTTEPAELVEAERLPEIISLELFQTLMIISFFVSFYWYKHRGEAA